MKHERGFVLVNALILVAAFAAAAVLLLARAESARVRQAEWQGADQMVLYLDAFEALVINTLDADQLRGPVDSPVEGWAREDINVTIDRGRAAGLITDLQGRFNVNWLSNPEDAEARAAFGRLVQRLGLLPGVADEVITFVTPDGPGNLQAYARSRPPVRPVGGPVLIPEQLQAIPGLSPDAYAALKPYIAALPGDSQLNVNTASDQVLLSLLSGSDTGGVRRLLEQRKSRPFVSGQDFISRLAAVASVSPDLDETRFSVGSNWFHADIAARLDGRILERQTVFERLPVPIGTQVAYRLEDRE